MIGCHISQFYDNLPPIVQIYTHSTTPYRQYEHVEEMTDKLKESGIKFYVHSTFNCVPAGANFKFFMRKQFQLAHKIGAKGIIVHIPNRPTIGEIVESFDIGLKSKKTKIYLEHIPGKYADPELLENIYQLLSGAYPDIKFGICIDTCHIYVSGYDLSDPKVMSEYLEKISKIGCPILVHLNDSMGELGSKLDRHDALGAKIWTKSNFESLQMLLNKKWDCIAEVNFETKFPACVEFLNYISEQVGDNK